MEQQLVQKFDEKTEKKVVNALKKIFNLEDNPLSEEDALKGDSFFRIDVANVCMVEAKTTESRLVLAKFTEKNWECPYNLPNLEFLARKDIEIVSKYGSEYLKSIITLLNVTDESVEIKINNNYPGQFSNKHWKVTLAPRVGDD